MDPSMLEWLLAYQAYHNSTRANPSHLINDQMHSLGHFTGFSSQWFLNTLLAPGSVHNQWLPGKYYVTPQYTMTDIVAADLLSHEQC